MRCCPRHDLCHDGVDAGSRGDSVRGRVWRRRRPPRACVSATDSSLCLCRGDVGLWRTPRPSLQLCLGMSGAPRVVFAARVVPLASVTQSATAKESSAGSYSRCANLCPHNRRPRTMRQTRAVARTCAPVVLPRTRTRAPCGFMRPHRPVWHCLRAELEGSGARWQSLLRCALT